MTDVNERIRSLASRVAAVALLAGLLWGAVTMVVQPAYERYRALGAEIQDVRAQLGRVQTILTATLETPVAADRSDQSWRGQSRSIVAARVQEFLQNHARRRGVSIISISPLETRAFKRFDAIGLRIECEGEIGAVRDLIAAFENARPFLFITGTDLRRQQIFGVRRPGQKLPLAARLDIYAPFAEETGS